jgi:CheY-like chemotaxis protein
MLPYALIVDRNENSATIEFIRRELQGDYTVGTAEDGKQALEILKKRTKQNDIPDISLLITGATMPKMDGFELTEEMRKTYGDDVGIILGSGRAVLPEIQEQTKEAGANALLPKPFDTNQLKEAIALATKGYHLPMDYFLK